MTITEYIAELNKQFATGQATEHSYRPALTTLLASMLSELTVTNEPKRSECGAPDYILARQGVPVAFVEAKDIDDADLAGRKKNKEQFDRYKKSLDNIVFTDYIDFLLYEHGELVDSVRIGEVQGGKIKAIRENEAKFRSIVERLAQAEPQRITSSAKLAEIMASKARLLADVIEQALIAEGDQGVSELFGQMKAFRDVLISDITPKTFADIYAQTIAYGMFAARLHDHSPDTFSRQEAELLIPRTNPFLRQIFHHIAGFDLDDRIAWVVDDLAEAFRATDIRAVMNGYGQRTRQTDPILHFYEDFLSAYDPALRKSRGVWYTPQPVVGFIVRAVDEVLQRAFGLPMGLADTSKTTVQVANQKHKKSAPDTYKIDTHKVQILDPATGTGTFLAEVVAQIHGKMAGQQGLWQGYVEDHLLPRLNGFELLMASYAMAHLKLDMVLSETGYVAKQDKRLRVYLTNSLEESHPDTGTLFAQWLANEANEANRIKRDTPVMVVMGNPPYSGISTNKGEWITGLIDDYKYVDGVHFNERKHWLNDDYVKFIRLGQEFVDRNTEGVLAYINNHSFLDNPTFRGMRWHLMQSFDKIYIIDLHGNSKKKEVCPDGSKDENVFDIQQGVSINIFVKTGNKAAGALAEVFHCDLYGRRAEKYSYLAEHDLKNVPFAKLSPNAPFYFFLPKDEGNRGEYEQGFRVDELFSINTTGIVTARDSLVIDIDKKELHNRIKYFCDLSISDYDIRQRYFGNRKDGKYLAGDSRGWELARARKDICAFDHETNLQRIAYRPFDDRFIYYHHKMVDWGREKVMQHFLNGENVGLVFRRQQPTSRDLYLFCTKHIIADGYIRSDNKGGESVAPLYLYPTDGQTTTDGVTRRPNLKPEIVKAIAEHIGLEFVPEKSTPGAGAHVFAPIDLLDYIYGVLHTPAYRERYKEFLKTDFPRIPYPETADEFRRIAAVGAELRQVHLLEQLPPVATRFNIAGSNTVEKPNATEPDPEGNVQVWINDTQHFDGVPLAAWEFYIGGYQPAQKWLKDRAGRTLSYDEITHYQRIVAALAHTHALMQQL